MTLIKLGIPQKASDGLGYPLIKETDRFKHLFCLGGTGSGKTTFFLNLIKNTSAGCIVLDPNGDLAEKVYSFFPDAIYVNKINPISLNPLTRKLDKSNIANELVEVINSSVKAVSPEQMEITVKMARILRKAVDCIDGSDIGFLSGFLDNNFKRIKYFKTHHQSEYWKKYDRKGYEYTQLRMSGERISDRLSLLYDDENLRPFLKGDNQLDIKEIARQKKIVIFNFYGLDDQATAFVGNLVTNQIKSYYLHEATPQSPPLYFYCDEYNLFINELYSRFLAESRKYNISVNLSGHSFKQVSLKLASMILGNCFVKVYMGGFSEDKKLFQDQLNYKIPELGKYEAVIGIGNDPHHVKLYPPPEIKPLRKFNFLKDSYINLL